MNAIMKQLLVVRHAPTGAVSAACADSAQMENITAKIRKTFRTADFSQPKYLHSSSPGLSRRSMITGRHQCSWMAATRAAMTKYHLA
jgi:hypothetical protein